jgi:centrin-3
MLSTTQKSSPTISNSNASFTARSKSARTVVASLSDDQRTEIKEAFDLFDAEKSGGLDYHALKVSMRALGFDIKKEEVQQIMQQRGSLASGYSGDGGEEGQGLRIDYKDFEEVLAERYLARDPEEEMKKSFALFDEDGRGLISIKALKRVAKELGETLTDDEITAMVEEFDADGDGMISQEEFIGIMKMTSLY